MPPISSQVKFSYNIVKGSPEARRMMAGRLNEAFYQVVQPKIKDDRIAIEDFEQAFYSVMPEEVNVKVKKYSQWFTDLGGQSTYLYDKENNVIGQTIEIPLRSGKIKSKSVVVGLHESRHVLDTLCNPKYTARTIIMDKKGLYTKKFDRLYNNELYNYEPYYTVEGKIDRLESLKKKILKFLKKMSVENQINCIQDMRYSLETEYNAYGDTAKYARKLRNKKHKINPMDLEDDRRSYMFSEKIALLKKIGFDIIQAERERFAQSLQK